MCPLLARLCIYIITTSEGKILAVVRESNPVSAEQRRLAYSLLSVHLGKINDRLGAVYMSSRPMPVFNADLYCIILKSIFSASGRFNALL